MLDRIENERWSLHLSKEGISKKLGITSKTYNAYVQGSPIPSNILISLSKMTGKSVDYLLGVETLQTLCNEPSNSLPQL